MKNSSLEEATILITDTIMNTEKLDKIDKLELLINIQHFLDPKTYRENVKTLEKKEKDKGRKYENTRYVKNICTLFRIRLDEL